MEKRILVTVDDSAANSLGLEYVAYLFANDPEVKFILLNYQISGEEILPEPEDNRNTLMPDRGYNKKKQKCLLLLGKANQKLQSLGIPEERISIICQVSSNIASAIQKYGEQNLVDSIVLTKRGVGLLGELLMGSVSSEVSDKCHSIPLWIINGKIQSKKILVPVDGTPSSLMAVDHLAYIFSGRTDIHFYFFHARGFLSPPPVCKPETFYDRWGKDWCDKHLSGDGCLFTGPTDLLTDAAIPEKCIHSLPIPKAIEESTAILKNARKQECGTIAIGRKPQSETKGLFGGVSKRTILQADNCAIWLIG